MKYDYIMYTDGAYRHTSDVGGYGAIILNNKDDGEKAMRCIMGTYKRTNSFRMEIMSIIKALECVHDANVLLYNDALPAMRLLNKKIKNEAHEDLWKYYEGVITRRRISVDFVWVKGHSGDTYNEIADYIAQKAVNIATESPRDDIPSNPWRRK